MEAGQCDIFKMCDCVCDTKGVSDNERRDIHSLEWYIHKQSHSEEYRRGDKLRY